MATTTRIVKETEKLQKEPPPGIAASPTADNPRYFKVVVAGPSQSAYEGGVFNLELFLPEEYPMAPPKVRFLTRIYHPNVDKIGRICLDILKDKWSPALTIKTALVSLQALMSAPEPDDPQDAEVATMYKTDRSRFERKAAEWTATSSSRSRAHHSRRSAPQPAMPARWVAAPAGAITTARMVPVKRRREEAAAAATAATAAA